LTTSYPPIKLHFTFKFEVHSNTSPKRSFAGNFPEAKSHRRLRDMKKEKVMEDHTNMCDIANSLKKMVEVCLK